ncbi:ABC transporter permease [Martelella mangrovi]|uniref:Phospholipid/cholesterol/gamma-HCH transport system permease protein n=1 Tax=Martelella mangrovi TaxID=1397477 RepID=A0ABV2I8W5_9HYPH
MQNADESKASLTVETGDGGTASTLCLRGYWTVRNARLLSGEIDRLRDSLQGAGGTAVLDLSQLEGFDTAGAWMVREVQAECVAAGMEATLSGMERRVADLMEAIPETLPEPEKVSQPRPSLTEAVLDPVGKSAVAGARDVYRGVGFFGALFLGVKALLSRGGGVNMAAITAQLDHMGVRAVPIIALMSFLVGAIIAQQGAFQLSYFGAELFVVDLVGILQLREIGVLLTAIMIAGRSGSAITAEIGAMRMREEIDALRVMGFDPVSVLVFPRMLALLIALPLLTILANFSALLGAVVILDVYSGITLETFMQRFHEAVDMADVISGMLKAPVMALIIAIIASLEGMKVGGSAESLGQKVTASVVKSIFVVILADGIFAIFYAAINY